MENFKRRRATELKHGRIAMLGAWATAGCQCRACYLLNAVAARLHESFSGPAQDWIKVWFLSSRCQNRLCHIKFGNTVEMTLKRILTARGVPEDKVDSRVRQAIDALTAPAIKEIFDRKAPDNEAFQQLKTLATSKNFRFVQADEPAVLRGRRPTFTGRDPQSRPPILRKNA